MPLAKIIKFSFNRVSYTPKVPELHYKNVTTTPHPLQYTFWYRLCYWGCLETLFVLVKFILHACDRLIYRDHMCFEWEHVQTLLKWLVMLKKKNAQVYAWVFIPPGVLSTLKLYYGCPTYTGCNGLFGVGATNTVCWIYQFFIPHLAQNLVIKTVLLHYYYEAWTHRSI